MQHKLIAFPKTGIPYNKCLYRAVESLGIEVIEGVWSGRWLIQNVRSGDFIHIHWPSFLYFDHYSSIKTYVGYLRFRILLELMHFRGVRVLWTAHNLYPHDGGKNLFIHRVARKFIARRAKRVFVHGKTAATILANEFPSLSQKIDIVKHGNWIGYHRHSAAADEARKKLGLSPDKFVFSFVGSCKPYKNLELLIGVFKKMEGSSVLLIAGQFQSKEYLDKIIKLLRGINSDRWMFFPEFVDDDEIQNFVLAGNVLVLPYAEILTSGSAMLGLSFGRPVIAPNLGGLRDTVSYQCGLLYSPNNPDGLLLAMQSVQSMSFSERLIMDYARQYGWEDAASALVAVIEG